MKKADDPALSFVCPTGVIEERLDVQVGKWHELFPSLLPPEGASQKRPSRTVLLAVPNLRHASRRLSVRLMYERLENMNALGRRTLTGAMYLQEQLEVSMSDAYQSKVATFAVQSGDFFLFNVSLSGMLNAPSAHVEEGNVLHLSAYELLAVAFLYPKRITGRVPGLRLSLAAGGERCGFSAVRSSHPFLYCDDKLKLPKFEVDDAAGLSKHAGWLTAHR